MNTDSPEYQESLVNQLMHERSTGKRVLVIGAGTSHAVTSAAIDKINKLPGAADVTVIEDGRLSMMDLKTHGPETYLITNPYPHLDDIEIETGKKYERKLSPSINIHREYELIQQKKSKLSAWERRKIVELIENREQ